MDKTETLKKINESNNINDKIDGYLYLANVLNNTNAMLILGDYYFNTQKVELAIAYYKKAIENKNPQGYTRLGFMYYYGRGIAKDYMEAFKYFSRGALEGDTTSILKLSDMYKNGAYVEKNYGTSVNILDPLFQKGMKDLLDKKFKNNIIFDVAIRYADLFKNGNHFKHNLRKALKYYILAYRGFIINGETQNKNKIDYCLNNINILKEEITDLVGEYELLDFAFDVPFNFDYKISDNKAVLIFNFLNNELFIDYTNLDFKIYKKVIAMFTGVEKYNQVDYEVLRPNDYRIEKKKLRLYDDDSTLMHFEFIDFSLSAE